MKTWRRISAASTAMLALAALLAMPAAAKTERASIRVQLTIVAQCSTQSVVFRPSRPGVAVDCRPGSTPYQTRVFNFGQIDHQTMPEALRNMSVQTMLMLAEGKTSIAGGADSDIGDLEHSYYIVYVTF